MINFKIMDSYVSPLEFMEKINNHEIEIMKINTDYNGTEIICDLTLPFYFMSAWYSRNEKAIVKRFERWTQHHRELVIKCHFDSDLLVFSNCPSNLDPIMICRILQIPYEPEFGAGTFLGKDVILNVSKVKDYNYKNGDGC